MCTGNLWKPQHKAAAAAAALTPQRIAAYDNREATEAADTEARLRRRRAGAAANVLTGPMGIPGTAKLGQVM
jgi:hypothetical protein